MDDTINRQTAIEDFEKMFVSPNGNLIALTFDGCKHVIENLPTASPRWTPVTERLPKSREKVLVSTGKTVFTQVFKGIYRTPNRWIWEHSSIKKVAAWMPLPTPWKGEKNEQQS